MNCLGVLLAAGRSCRFGPRNKLLAPYRGKPLVNAAATALLGAGCEAVVAILSADEVAAVMPTGIEAHRLPPGLPMAASFRAAIDLATARDAANLLVCLGDMPNVMPPLLHRLRTQTGSCACQTEDWRTPPLLLSAADYRTARAAATGDQGARQFLKTLPPEAVIQISMAAALDIDYPEDCL